MGKIKHDGQWPPRMFHLRDMVIILVAWGASVLGMAGVNLIIDAQAYSAYGGNLGVATFSGKFVVGLFTFLGALALLGRIMR